MKDEKRDLLSWGCSHHHAASFTATVTKVAATAITPNDGFIG